MIFEIQCLVFEDSVGVSVLVGRELFDTGGVERDTVMIKGETMYVCNCCRRGIQERLWGCPCWDIFFF
jgi:hypothetical protein